MLDPFIVLGLTSDASKEEIKEIYRQLSRKYHPDNNINNPDKEYSDGMFRLIQSAYEQIIEIREYTELKSTAAPSEGPAALTVLSQKPDKSAKDAPVTGTERAPIQNAAALLRKHSYIEALRALMEISVHDAEWCYLTALAHKGAGSLFPAYEYAVIAVHLKPQNHRYQKFRDRLQSDLKENAKSTAAVHSEFYKMTGDFIMKGHFDEAIEWLKDVREHDEIWYIQMALASEGKGEIRTALHYADCAVRTAPANHEYRRIILRLEMKFRQTFIRLDDPSYLQNIIVNYINFHNTHEAIHLLNAVVERDYWWHYYMFQILLAQGNIWDAVQHLQTARKTAPRHAGLQNTLYYSNNYYTSTAAYHKCLRERDAQYGEVIGLMKNDQYKEALQKLQRMSGLPDQRWYQLASDAYERLGDDVKAHLYYMTSGRIGPDRMGRRLASQKGYFAMNEEENPFINLFESLFRRKEVHSGDPGTHELIDPGDME